MVVAFVIRDDKEAEDVMDSASMLATNDGYALLGFENRDITDAERILATDLGILSDEPCCAAGGATCNH